MTRIIYPYTWQNVGENQLSYTLLCKTDPEPWKLNIPVKDVIHGMTKGLHNRLRHIYLKSGMTITSLEGNECFYIYEKAQDYFELQLPAGWYVILPTTLARALGYLNHQYNIPQLYQIGGLVQQNDDHSVLLARTTTTLVRQKRIGVGIALKRRFSNHLRVFRFNRVSRSGRWSSQLTSAARSSWSAGEHDHRRGQAALLP